MEQKSYVNKLNVQNEKDSYITNAIFVAASSIGLVLGPLFILPKLQKRGYGNIQILLVKVIIQ